MSEKLVLKFDPNTIEHLGISLYSKLPSVLSELISNSWDADATKVTIDFIEEDSNKEIIYSDNGEGMTFDELNDNYLVIGRNRRKNTLKDETTRGRKVIGKKGLGKLSVFGICDIAEVISIKNGFKTHFIMNLLEIKASKETLYEPQIIEKDSVSSESSGTTLKLKQIRRKTGFDLNSIALSLSKKFLIFDEMSVDLTINNSNKLSVTNELKFSDLNIQFEWKFPDNEYDSTYEYSDDIKGTIFTLKTPIKDTEMRGIFLTSRGKVVNIADFYGIRDNDQFHSYVTGYIEVDFIDDFDEDVISTNRHSLNWEHDKTRELQQYLQTVIKKIGSEWRIKRADLKNKTIKDEKNIDIDNWKDSLATYEKELMKK